MVRLWLGSGWGQDGVRLGLGNRKCWGPAILKVPKWAVLLVIYVKTIRPDSLQLSSGYNNMTLF